MKLAIRAYIVTLILLTVVFAVSAQQRSGKDDRNIAPTVGTGGPVGGPTGLFTVYDGQTLRKGEYTLSLAYSNYDRDPGDVDITTTPISFNIGITDNVELFATTEGFRGIKVNSPRNLSGFYLPNSQVRINGVFTSGPAIVLAPSGPGNGPFENTAVFRPTGLGPFSQYPFTGSNAGTYGLQFPFFSGPQFGFPAGTNALLGPPQAGGAASNFPGVGSVYGSILPGVVLTTTPLVNAAGDPVGEAPVIFATAPSYFADAPFINRTYGTSSFNSIDFGVKWRMNSNNSPIGYGLIASYKWYLDTASSFSGFNQLQRGAGPGANRGDVNLTFFADARLAEWVNLSGNIGYTYTTNPKSNLGSGSQVTLLDRPDELLASIAVDFPVNKHVQPIFEFRSLQYVGGRTPNAFERNPLDGLAGIRIFPRRWWGIGAAYRYNFNQQDSGSFDEITHTSNVVVACADPSTECQPVTLTTSYNGVPPGFVASTSPSGFIGQFWIGRRNPRLNEIVNQPANVDSVDLSATVITLPCRPGYRSKSGACNDNKMVDVATKASDPENDVLTYNYTVSGGRVIGAGANVQWDLSNAQAGTYTITTGVDDGCGVCGKTDTKTIKVEECPDCVQICDCPTLSLNGPSGITNPGDTMTFVASVSGGKDVTYNWTVSAGTIESGQGTSSITVRTTSGMAGENVTATVEIGGLDPDCNCPASASETAGIESIPGVIDVDEFGPQKDDEIKARVDNFYIQLNNNPNAQGYVINYGTPAEIKKRVAQIDKAIKFRGYDRSRLTFVNGPDNGDGVRTKFSIVPPGAEAPMP